MTRIGATDLHTFHSEKTSTGKYGVSAGRRTSSIKRPTHLFRSFLSWVHSATAPFSANNIDAYDLIIGNSAFRSFFSNNITKHEQQQYFHMQERIITTPSPVGSQVFPCPSWFFSRHVSVETPFRRLQGIHLLSVPLPPRIEYNAQAMVASSFCIFRKL